MNNRFKHNCLSIKIKRRYNYYIYYCGTKLKQKNKEQLVERNALYQYVIFDLSK